MPREDRFFAQFNRHAQIVLEGAMALRELLNGGASVAEGAHRVMALEIQADTIARDVLLLTRKTFVTPIDREDLQKLSQELDDVLDLMNGAARACVLYGVERPTTPMVGLIDKLVECTAVLKKALPHLRAHDYAALMTKASEVALAGEKKSSRAG